jgi:hypothetical protein
VIQVSAPTRLPLRRTRASRFRTLYPERRPEPPSWRVVAAVAVPLVVLAAVAYFARRRFFQGVALVAEAVEEVADVVEDAAEDLAEAAKERAERSEAAE